ncbi:hypothetical protein B0J17DRAFT_723858 [Rhizoctonia solani]|nr:hypothetical protein B0J17DRAFT_723858 [Rhizoctonia solani]
MATFSASELTDTLDGSQGTSRDNQSAAAAAHNVAQKTQEFHVDLDPDPLDGERLPTLLNSAVFIQPNARSYSKLSGDNRRAWSSIPRSCTDSNVLHWVNAFKGEPGEMLSKYQVWMAMVSTHYIYGAAHYSNDKLAVFAGAWTGEANDESSSQNAKASVPIFLQSRS